MSSENLPLKPLDRFQSLVWMGQQLDPENPIYNTAFRIRIDGALDASRFEQAFRSVVRRSESLRSCVQVVAGMPQRRIIDNPDFEFLQLDFSAAEAPLAAAQQWCQNRCQHRFALDGALFDSALIRCGPEQWVWFICQHHIFCDAWSVSQVFRNLIETYHADPDAQLPQLPGWSRDVDDEATASRDLQSPAKFYGESPPEVRSVVVRQQVAEPDDRWGQMISELAAGDVVRSFSAELSRFNLLLTIYVAFLHRVTAQDTVSIGVPFHGRLTPAAEQVVGSMIELYPLAVSIAEQETFRSLFTKVQTATTEFLKLATSGKRPSTSNASFNSVFNFINAKFPSFGDQAVDVHWLDTGYCDREHHVRLHVEDFSGQGLAELRVDLNVDVFGEHAQSRVIGDFRKLIEAMYSDWDCALRSVRLTEMEDAILVGNCTPESDALGLVIDRILERCLINSDQLAIREQDQRITYGELDQRTEELAARIAEHDAGPVAIMLPRSAHAVLGMVASWRCGRPFVPVDPTWPRTRRNFVLANSGATVALTRADYEGPLPDGVTQLRVDQLSNATKDDLPTEPAKGANLAYVLYTSGSTGEPKGVEISHESFANYINWADGYYVQGKQLRFPLFTPLTFDLTMTSIFLPLVSGGTLEVYPKSAEQFDVSIMDVLGDNRVDIVKLTPSHLGLVRECDLSASHVKQLILGGEDLREDVAAHALRQFPSGLVIHNEYGPTEATVGCVVYSLTAEHSVSGPSVPIGTPIANMRASVLGDHLEPVLNGHVGQLYVSGAGLACGYLGNPRLTAEKFITHPADGNRWYATGDLVRQNRQRQLEYLGRMDQQVKIRGARVELGAIEKALTSHADISAAVVNCYDTVPDAAADHHCSRCGLASNYPEATFDDDGVCNLCQEFENYRDAAQDYFRPLTELEGILKPVDAPGSRAPDYDCLALLSGGKDSTYMLSRLADMGLRILAFTLDNGFISNEAKANIRRVVKALGVDHHFASTEAMNEIFVDSLQRFANVCQGCFKTIYMLAMNLAREKRIPFIVTGLSRGQFFETRLTADLFDDPCSPLLQIDQTILAARKAYHRVDDAVRQHLDVANFMTDEIFEEVQILDFYRYCDVDLDEMLSYLDRRLPWVRPSDTGRSTNCLINDVGIYVHKARRGFHNYALPYSWDVRLGHKQREAALDELDDEIDVVSVHRILREIGFDEPVGEPDTGKRLVAYYVSTGDLTAEELTTHLSDALPDFMIPSRFVAIDQIPLSSNGKVDLAKLPNPLLVRPTTTQADYVAPRNDAESQLAEIWQQVLQVPQVGVHDNFFDLGGDSILAIQIIARCHRRGLQLTPAQLFDLQTVGSLANLWEGHSAAQAVVQDEIQPGTEFVQTPIVRWMLEHQLTPTDYWNQSIEIAVSRANADTPARIRQALVAIVNRYPALRQRCDLQGTRCTILPPIRQDDLPWCELVGDQATLEELRTSAKQKLNAQINLGAEPLVGAALLCAGDCDRLLLVANHVGIDAVSWHLILDCLRGILSEGGTEGFQQYLTSESGTIVDWSRALGRMVGSERFGGQFRHWLDLMQETRPPVTGSADPSQPATVGTLVEISRQLDVSTSRKLAEQIAQTRFRLHEVLLIAFGTYFVPMVGSIATENFHRAPRSRAGGE